MTIDGLETTNLWLGIIAIVSVLQILALGAVAWFGYRAYHRAIMVLSELESRHVAPLSGRVSRILDEVQHVTARVKDAEDVVRDKVRLVAHTGSLAVTTLKARTWLLIGIVRGVRAGLAVLRDRDGDRGRRMRPANSHRTSTLQGGIDARATSARH